MTQDVFAVDASLTHLNHASYGAPSVEGLTRAHNERRYLEFDTSLRLGSELVARLQTSADAVANEIHASVESIAVVANTTEANAALAASLPLGRGDRVLMLDLEYASVIRGWQVRCEAVGAEFALAHLELPANEDSVLSALDDASEGATIAVVSAVTSSTALHLPVRRIAEWAAERSIDLLVDAAHVVGHVDFDVSTISAAAVFGSLHKWLPVPRPVGFLWLSPELIDVVRPAAVSLDWDAANLVERFGWPGTWDPAAALGVPAALTEYYAWESAGLTGEAAELMNDASEQLSSVGLVPTGEPSLLPPRMRAFMCPGTDTQDWSTVLADCGLRVWVGTGASGETVIRVATHVYNDAEDISRLLYAVERVSQSV